MRSTDMQLFGTSRPGQQRPVNVARLSCHYILARDNWTSSLYFVLSLCYERGRDLNLCRLEPTNTGRTSQTSNSNTDMSPVGDGCRCLLKELPAELRNCIFELALTEDSPLAICTDDRPPWSQEPHEAKISYALPGSKSELKKHYDKYGGLDDIDCK